MLDDQIFMAGALLDAYESTVDSRYFALAERAMLLAIEKFGDAEHGGFFDRASNAAPMGGLEVRRKPFQDSPTPGTNSAAVVVLERLYAFTGDAKYHDWARLALEGFAGIAPQYGMFAATYGLAALLHSQHAPQIVITGDAGDSRSAALEAAANSVYRFGKTVLRVTPEIAMTNALAPFLKETIPHLNASVPQAFVCAGTTCQPPVSAPGELFEMLSRTDIQAAAK